MLLVTVACPCISHAAIEPATLARLKAATVFISLGQHRAAGSGSGFLVHRANGRGLIVTNAHVVRGASAPDAISVVFHSGTRRADPVPARILAMSRARDLAVLEVEHPALPTPLEVSHRATIHETQAVHIVGFPFGKGFATNRETPVVSLSRGTVSSQRLDVNDQPRLLQIDGDLNPGNSGGPIVDEAGRVVGVAVATVRQTNIGFAIPLSPLTEMLAGTITDLAGERTERGVRVRGAVLDPLDGFRSARLRVRVMAEDKVLDLLGPDARWSSIAPGLPGAPFTADLESMMAAEHELPDEPPTGMSMVGQISILSESGERHLPPFRLEARSLAIAISGPDARPQQHREASGQENAPDSPAGPGAMESELEELFARSGINEQIASMASPTESIFNEAPRSDDERTVKERLGELIAGSWDEERIRRVYVRTFEAEPNADALRRALQIMSLPAMKTLHLTMQRLARVETDALEGLEKARKRDPGVFEQRLDLMRTMDERRNFSSSVVAALSTSVESLSRLLNEIHPRERRMAPELLERDVAQAMARIGTRVRRAVPLMLMHQYRDVADADLRDYMKQLDSPAMRWFSRLEMAAHGAVVAAQFGEAEEEILELFREVRREALGLPERPELAGLPVRQALRAVLDAYGKAAVIDFMLERRGGEISVAEGGGIRSRFGRPAKAAVTPATLAADLEALSLDPPAFISALENHLANKAYKDRRLTARGERSRLIAALLERRRARMNQGPRAKQRAEKAALRDAERKQKRQCLQACATSRDECRNRALKSEGFCKTLAPANPRSRNQALVTCRDKRRVAESICHTEHARCQPVCQ